MTRIESVKKKFPKLNIDPIAKKDPSSNHKYLEWMCREITNGSRRADVYGTISGYHTYINALRCEIEKLSCKELEDKVKDHLSKLKEKEVGDDGYYKVFEDDDQLLVEIFTKDASIKYGKGTKWCISGKNNNYFDEYIENNRIFFLINKKEKDTKTKSSFTKNQLSILRKFEDYENILNDSSKFAILLDYQLMENFPRHTFRVAGCDSRIYLNSDGDYCEESILIHDASDNIITDLSFIKNNILIFEKIFNEKLISKEYLSNKTINIFNKSKFFENMEYYIDYIDFSKLDYNTDNYNLMFNLLILTIGHYVDDDAKKYIIDFIKANEDSFVKRLKNQNEINCDYSNDIYEFISLNLKDLNLKKDSPIIKGMLSNNSSSITNNINNFYQSKLDKDELKLLAKSLIKEILADKNKKDIKNIKK